MRKGFTLIELMMAMAILVIMLTLSVTIFVRYIHNERREIAERALQEDIRFALELFIREARTAYASTYTTFDNGHGIFFLNQKGECVTYQLRNRRLQRGTAAGPCVGSPTFASWEEITNQTTILDSLIFQVPVGVTAGGVMQRQGFVTIIVVAQSTTSAIPSLAVETTVTSRQVIPYVEL